MTPPPYRSAEPPLVPFTPSTPRFWLSVLLCALPWLLLSGLASALPWLLVSSTHIQHAAASAPVSAKPSVQGSLFQLIAVILGGSLLLHLGFQRRAHALKGWQLVLYPLLLLPLAALAWGFVAGVLTSLHDEEVKSPLSYVLMAVFTSVWYLLRMAPSLIMGWPLGILSLALMRRMASPPRPVKPML